MTINLGLWIIPMFLTLAGIAHLGTRKPQGQYDFGGAALALVWLAIAVTAWAMWGLSWLI